MPRTCPDERRPARRLTGRRWERYCSQSLTLAVLVGAVKTVLGVGDDLQPRPVDQLAAVTADAVAVFFDAGQRALDLVEQAFGVAAHGNARRLLEGVGAVVGGVRAVAVPAQIGRAACRERVEGAVVGTRL